MANNALLKILQRMERAAAHAQGKGYGAATISQEVRTLCRFIDANGPALAVDIGGNVGNYTAELLRRFPNIEVHIFEPSEVNCRALEERFRRNQQVVLVPRAVSGVSGPSTLFSDRSGSGLGSLTRRRLAHAGIQFNVQETVQSIRFEDYWRSTLNAKPIDIAKLDIEGHELSALEGFGAALDAVRVIQFEFGGCNIDTRTFFQDFWYFFVDRGFEIYRVAPWGAVHVESYSEAHEFFSTTNYVAVNRALK